MGYRLIAVDTPLEAAKLKHGNSKVHLLRIDGDELDNGHRVVYTCCGIRVGYETLQVIPIANMDVEWIDKLCSRCMKGYRLETTEDDNKDNECDDEAQDVAHVEGGVSAARFYQYNVPSYF